MTTPTQPTPTPPTGDAPPPKSFLDRIPRRLFRGRVRTTTAVLVIVFIGLLALYGQRTDYYTKLDERAAAASASREAAIPRATTTEDTPVYTEPTRSSTRSSSSTAPSVSGSTSPDSTTDPNSTGTVPTTTTTAPGFQFPTIPGIVLPGQTPTTTPVR